MEDHYGDEFFSPARTPVWSRDCYGDMEDTGRSRAAHPHRARPSPFNVLIRIATLPFPENRVFLTRTGGSKRGSARWRGKNRRARGLNRPAPVPRPSRALPRHHADPGQSGGLPGEKGSLDQSPSREIRGGRPILRGRIGIDAPRSRGDRVDRRRAPRSFLRACGHRWRKANR